MGQAIPRQHPAVVLRSHFNQLRALLAVAMVAIVGLTVAVVILANDDEISTTSSSTSTAAPLGTTRADGGPEEGTRGIVRQPTADTSIGARMDGGPEEGTRGLATTRPAPSVDASLGARMDGGPEEGTADVTAAQPRVTQQQAFPGLADQANGAASPPAAESTRSDGGPEEGSALR
jgi:hypothetical protein